MIKSHQPRGHYWSHASAFQQTKENRNIRYDDCILSEEEVLVPDSDDEVSSASRASKRRRIEKLADDFLNGERLVVPSLPLCLDSVRSAVFRDGKGAKVEDRRQAEMHATHTSGQVWKDMETDEEILARLLRNRGPYHKKPDDPTANAPPNDLEVTASNLQAQANCAPSRATRLHRLTLGPSEEALRQAAALRDRRTQRSKSELPVVRTAPSTIQQAQLLESCPHSDSYVDNGQSQLAGLPNDWLSRRRSRFSSAQRDDEEEESGDELRLSNKTPSQKRHGRRRSSQSRKQLSLPDHSGDSLRSTRSSNEPSNQVARNSEQSEQQASYRTAPETAEPEIGLNPFQLHPQDDNQTHLHKSPDKLARPHKLWTAVNESFQSVAHALTPVATSSTSAPASTVQGSLYDSIKGDATKPIKGSRTTARTSDTPQPTRCSARIRSAPTTVSQASPSSELSGAGKESITVTKTYGKRSRYPNIQSTQNGTSPFVWRRFSSESLVGEAQDAVPAGKEQITMRRPVKFASSDNIEVADGRSSVRNQRAPDTSSEYDQASFRAPNATLTDEPQVSDQTRMSALDSQCWPGTQAALQQAEKNLFTSPEKRDAVAETSLMSSNEPSGIVRPSSQGRESLKQLSREPMPSTQALIDNFAGFSTVKKPGVAYRDSPTYTPTAVGKGARKDSNARDSLNLSSTAPQTSTTKSDSTRRSSALRQSITAIESPLDTSRRDISLTRSMTPAAATTEVVVNDKVTPRSILKSSGAPNGLTRSPLAAPSAPLPSGGVSSFPSFTSGPELSSFQAAQPRSGLPRDESSLRRTIDELTRDVLSTADTQGVLSQ